MTTKPTIEPIGDPSEEEPSYWKPADVPRDLTPIERAIVAARNVRAWADWLLQEGPAPDRSDVLTDVGEKGDGRT